MVVVITLDEKLKLKVVHHLAAGVPFCWCVKASRIAMTRQCVLGKKWHVRHLRPSRRGSRLLSLIFRREIGVKGELTFARRWLCRLAP